MRIGWTDKEIGTLKKRWVKGVMAEEIGLELDRSPQAVMIKARELDLPFRCKRWTEEEIETLKQRRADGWTSEQIGVELGRSTKAVEVKAIKLQLPAHTIPRRDEKGWFAKAA